jgi:hypothetical protein
MKTEIIFNKSQSANMLTNAGIVNHFIPLHTITRISPHIPAAVSNRVPEVSEL